MHTSSSKDKEIRIPGLTIPSRFHRLRAATCDGRWRIVAGSAQALRLEEKGYPPAYYLPRNDADMTLRYEASVIVAD